MDSVILIARLQTLECQISEAPAYLDRAYATAGTSAFALRKVEVALHLHATQQTSEAIRGCVLGNDDLGDEVDSLTELVLRAIRLVLRVEFDNLAMVIRAPDARDRVPAFSGAFFSCEALRVFLDFQLAWRIRGWSGDRIRLRADRPFYRTLLRSAEASLVAVRARLLPLLQEGATRSDWSALADVCRRMQDVLAIRIGVQPDQPLMIYARLGEVTQTSGAN